MYPTIHLRVIYTTWEKINIIPIRMSKWHWFCDSQLNQQVQSNVKVNVQRVSMVESLMKFTVYQKLLFKSDFRKINELIKNQTYILSACFNFGTSYKSWSDYIQHHNVEKVSILLTIIFQKENFDLFQCHRLGCEAYFVEFSFRIFWPLTIRKSSDFFCSFICNW